MDYRREIDGLRALAVLPVVLFHAGFDTFGGGYVGVDVFFVISGYLITSIIATQLQAERFSIAEFYERRARRILPAIFVVISACIPFAWLWLPPTEMNGFSQSIVAVCGFVSNILFWRESGYFDTQSELKPLLHTWSLAVEEQYYLFFPILLMLTWKLGRRSLVAIMVAIAAASFALAVWGSTRAVASTFFLLPTRGWELLMGALVAMYLLNKPTLKNRTLAGEFLSVAGFALIVISVLTYNKQTPFPGTYALAPTVGTALIILYARPETWVGKLLGLGPMVGIGLISYSAYLFHQPLFAFARHRLPGEPGEAVQLALAGLAFLLAYLVWRFIETPFRNKQNVGRPQLLAVIALGTALLLTFGVGGYATAGYAGRFNAAQIAAFSPPKTDFERLCFQQSVQGDPYLKACNFGDLTANSTFVLYGDSHAQAIFSALDVALRAKNVKGVFITNEACAIPQILDSRSRLTGADCDRSNAALLQYINTHADTVAVLLRWTYRLYPIPNIIDSLLFDNQEGGIERGDEPRINFTTRYGGYSTEATGKKSAVHEFVSMLANNSRRLLLIYPIPEAGWHIPKHNFQTYLSAGEFSDEVSTSHALYRKRNEFAETTLDGAVQASHVIRIRPEHIFCSTSIKDRCVAQTKGTPLYYDEDHVSNAGARLLVDEIARHLNIQPANSESASTTGAR